MLNNVYKRFQYPNGTLKNKLSIRNPAQLASIEYRTSAEVSAGLLKNPVRITNLKQLFIIHKLMFGSIYSWAGQLRDYDLSKSSHDFVPHNVLKYSIIYINRLITKFNQNNKLSAWQYAKLLDSINEMHPFREGNGRSTKTFLQMLAESHHQFINYPRKQDRMVRYLNQSDIEGIARLIKIVNLK